MDVSRTRFFYFAAMLVAGIAIGFLIRANPEWQHMAVPPAAWPFGVSFIIDLAICQVAARTGAAPLTMGDRFIGVIGSALIVTLITAL